jgi:hypothetical protein
MRSLLLLDSARRAPRGGSVDGTGIAASAAAARRRDLGVDRRVLSIMAALALAGVLTLSILLPSGALAAGDANKATCPNEALTGFRPYLADCRAYEMVSPPYKAGQSVRPSFPVFAADNGEAMDFSSTGVFAEAPASVQGANGYLATRGNYEWSTVSIDPNTAISPSFGLLEQPLDVSADLSRSLVLYVFSANYGQSNTATSGAFYLRERDGTQVKASPTFTTLTADPLFVGGGISYRGGAADLSTIVFAMKRSLLPSDTVPAGPERLYEVSGAGGPSPTLEPVDPSCGAQLGSGGIGSAYHAISRDGKRIFFTCGNVHVRIDGSGTYNVSAGSATFEGANEEGSKVFFLEEGNLYMAEVGSTGVSPPVLVSEEVRGVTRVSSDGSHVYFVARGLLTADTNSTDEGHQHQGAIAGADNLYGFDTVTKEPPRFVAVLCPNEFEVEEEGVGGVTQCPSGASDKELWGTEDHRPADATPNGEFLVFDSFGQLITAGPEADTNVTSDVYEYDFETGALRRISLGVGGYGNNGNSNSFGAEITAGAFDSLKGAVHWQYGLGTRAVTDNGSTVVFRTAERLSPLAVNGLANVYEWHEGAVSLVSDGHSPTADSFPVVTPSGRDIFFKTSDGVLPQDVDGVEDVYDAREDGGFALAPIPPGPCGGEACRGPLSASPGLSLPGSATTASGENVSPSPARAVVKKAKAKTKRKKKGRKTRRSRGHAFAGSAHTTLRGNSR